MRVYISGATGLLGSALMRTAPPEVEPIGARVDIMDRGSIAELFDASRPDAVIHCAGDGRVDFAEENPDEALSVNMMGTNNMIWTAAQYKCRFIHISTNAVFDGSAPPYNEYSDLWPANEYGRSKMRAEIIVRGYPFSHTIIRPIMLYGWPMPGKRGNMVTRILGMLQQGAPVPVANDILTQPTYVDDCASAIWKTLDMHDIKTLHIAPQEKMTLFKFASLVARVWGYDPGLIRSVPSSHFETLAPRPADTTFDGVKMRELGITVRAPEEGLKAMREPDQ